MSPVFVLLAVVVAAAGITSVVLAVCLDERRYEPGPSKRGLRAGLLVSCMAFMSAGWLLTQQPGDEPGDPRRIELRGDAPAAGGDAAEPASQEAGARSPDATTSPWTDIEVAAALSQERYPNGEVTHVVLVRSGPSVDALVASGLHGLHDGPVLMTDSGDLSEETMEEIGRLETPSVLILGGEMAVSAQVEADLVAAGYDVHRHTGARGVDTAISVAERHFPEAETAIVVPAFQAGSARPGVLAAGSLAAAQALPVLVSDSGGLTEASADHLAGSAIRSVIVVGGDEGWRTSVEEDLTALGISITSVGGTNLFETAAALAELSRPAAEVAPLFLVEGSSDAMWPDMVVAVTRGMWDRARIVLSDGDHLPQATRDVIAASQAFDAELWCLDGVDEAACAEAAALLDS